MSRSRKKTAGSSAGSSDISVDRYVSTHGSRPETFTGGPSAAQEPRTSSPASGDTSHLDGGASYDAAVSVRDVLVRTSWLGALQHIYAHAWHGTATTIPGWRAFLWQHFNRCQVLLVPEPCGVARLEQADRFVRGLGAAPGECLIETHPGLDAGVEAELAERGWPIAYDLPGHVIPIDDEWRSRIGPSTAFVQEVSDEATLADFAYVQEQAYRESYDWPRGCAGLFYSNLASACGPDTIAHVLYVDGRPVRTAQLIRAGGLVHGVAGAAVPSVRGRHLGEALMYTLTYAARERFGAREVLHFTMPVARPIAARLGLETITCYRRWTLPLAVPPVQELLPR